MRIFVISVSLNRNVISRIGLESEKLQYKRWHHPRPSLDDDMGSTSTNKDLLEIIENWLVEKSSYLPEMSRHRYHAPRDSVSKWILDFTSHSRLIWLIMDGNFTWCALRKRGEEGEKGAIFTPFSFWFAFLTLIRELCVKGCRKACVVLIQSCTFCLMPLISSEPSKLFAAAAS